MREIKFRAWDNLRNEFIGSLCPRIDSISKDIHKDRYSLMQYTGLKDKNGVEIYEGDIVKAEYCGDDCQNYINQQIIWKQDFCMFTIGSCEEDEENLMEEIAENIEIIGNIYENKELLK